MKQDRQTQALPGFDEFITSAVDRAGENDFTASKYTAVNILRDYPETFKSIAAAMFKFNLPNRVIRELFHVNGMTVKGIHDMIIGASTKSGAPGEFLIKCRSASAKAIVQTRLLDAIIDKLDDDDTLNEMSVSKLVSLLKAIEPQTASEKSDDGQIKDVTIVEPAESYEDMINGLIEGKKSDYALFSEKTCDNHMEGKGVQDCINRENNCIIGKNNKINTCSHNKDICDSQGESDDAIAAIRAEEDNRFSPVETMSSASENHDNDADTSIQQM